MLALRRLVPQVRGVTARSIHQSVTARKEEATTIVAVEKKDESVAASVSSLTGKTGPIIAAGALGTVAYANELLIIHAESVVVATFAACVYGIYTKGGAALAELIKEQRDEAVSRYDKAKNDELESMTDELSHLKSQLTIENTVAMRYEVLKDVGVLEEEIFYRTRNNAVVSGYKQFLDTVSATAMAERKAEQMKIVDALEKDFVGSFDAAQDKLVIDQCIANLPTLKL